MKGLTDRFTQVVRFTDLKFGENIFMPSNSKSQKYSPVNGFLGTIEVHDSEVYFEADGDYRLAMLAPQLLRVVLQYAPDSIKKTYKEILDQAYRDSVDYTLEVTYDR